MYVSDYGYAASSSFWSTPLYNYDKVIANNWMYMGLAELTLAPQTNNSINIFSVLKTGDVNIDYVEISTIGVRPVFYLKSTVSYAGGSGTAAKPILVN